MKPGDVYRVAYVDSDGHEQSGERPSIILQDDSFAFKSPLVVTVPLSSQGKVVRFPAVIPITVTPDNGLSVRSFALVFQTQAVDRRRIRKKLGAVSPDVLNAVYDALDKLTGRVHTPGGTP